MLGIPNATTGTGFATLLLGYPSGVTIAPAVIPYQYRWKYWAGFFQDDWKVTPKLTLNIGLRYQIEVPRTEKHNMQGDFVDQPITLSTGAQQQGYIQLDGFGGTPSTLWPTRYNNWEPRFGFAYRLPAIIPGLQVMRGAYAINHVPTSGLFSTAFPDLSPKARIAGHQRRSQRRPGADGFAIRWCFRIGGLDLRPTASSPTSPTSTRSTISIQDVMVPYVQQWNFGLGFQFGMAMGMEVNYVGNKSTNMFGPSAIYNSVNLQEYTQEFEAAIRTVEAYAT